MRISRAIVGIGVPLIVAWASWKLCHYCCCKAQPVQSDLTQYGGVTAFAGIAFALNTSLAVRWIREQFLSYFDGVARRRVAKAVKARANDDAAKMLEEKMCDLKRRFCNALLTPSRIYMTLGIVFSLVIMALLFTGIPLSFRRFLILFPFPAFCYYGTAIAHAASVLLAFDDAAADVEENGEVADFGEMLDEAKSGKSSSAATSKKRKNTRKT